MSTAELIEKIRTLPPDKQKEVEGFVRGLVEKKKSSKKFDEAAAAVFSKHAKLLNELAR